jgi:hypothetical protein
MRSLSLKGCLLSDDDLRAIGDEQSLRFVHVGGPTVDERAFRAILSLPRLNILCVNGSPATGEGLADHPGSKTLTSFWSKETPLGEEFAAFMAKCPKLRAANLFDARATAEFTRQLENHPSLEELTLARGGLTEASIDNLLTIPHLTRLLLPVRLLKSDVEARIKTQRPDLVVRAFND